MKKDTLNIKNGFSLIEVLLSMSLLFLAFLISVPLFTSFLFRSEIDDAINVYYRSLRTAQTFAQSSLQDTPWGVRFNAGQVIVFSGTTFASRNVAFDRSFDISTRISATGITEIIFSEITGYPNTSGTITLNGSNVSKQITINARGQISF